MIEVHRLTPGLGEEHVAPSQTHVDPLPGAALATVGGEDQLLQPGGAGLSLAVVSLQVTHWQTGRTPRHRVRPSVELTSCNQRSLGSVVGGREVFT